MKKMFRILGFMAMVFSFFAATPAKKPCGCPTCVCTLEKHCGCLSSLVEPNCHNAMTEE
ncbi:hypothetical protein PHSC3_001804 [Chlamydiales bacterium STE3]|nr:hypothetical protein PHSC3_001804 [Chlamydiales bacterium STE3]